MNLAAPECMGYTVTGRREACRGGRDIERMVHDHVTARCGELKLWHSAGLPPSAPMLRSPHVQVVVLWAAPVI